MLQRLKAGRAVAVAVALAACSPQPHAITESEIVGLYDGVGYGDPVPQRMAIYLALRPDHSFVGVFDQIGPLECRA